MKNFPLTKKLSEFLPAVNLTTLNRAGDAYIAAVRPNVDNYLVPVADFIPNFKVYHDDTLVGDGTPSSPLSVVGGGSGSGSSGSGSSGSGGYSPVNIASPLNTILITNPERYAYSLESTNWGIRYNIDYDSEIYTTLEPINNEINTELIYEPEEKQALKFNITGNDSENVVTKFSISKNETDVYPQQIASFTGNFTFSFDPSLYNFYALNIESIGNTNNYGIDLYSGTVTKGTEPEELVFKSDYDALLARVERLERYLPTVDSELMFNNKPVMFNNKPLTYTE